MTGRGQTIAIVDAYRAPAMLADSRTYAALTGDPPLRPGQYRQYQAGPITLAGPRECDAQGWYTEEAIDVEAAHGMAPDAAVRYVAAGSCSFADMANALATVVNRRLATIVSNSWSALEDKPVRALYDTIFQLGASEGIGFFFSSGDLGYNSPLENPNSTHRQVDFPSSDPWVTSVGGTSLAIGRNRDYEFETAWGTLSDPLSASGTAWSPPPPGRYPADYRYSGGGGVSTIYRQPFYQRAVVPASMATHLPGWFHQRHADAGDPGRVRGGGPRHGFPNRADRVAARRPDLRLLARQVRRHQRGLPGVRRHRGGRPAGRRVPTRVREPCHLCQIPHRRLP